MSDEVPARPPGEYAIVELFGHTTLVGRVQEVERFGTALLAIEPLFGDKLLPVVYQGGASIYRFTPCSAEVAFAQQPRNVWQFPAVIRAVMPPALLGEDVVEIELHDEEDDDPADGA